MNVRRLARPRWTYDRPAAPGALCLVLSLVGCASTAESDGFRCDGDERGAAECYTTHYFDDGVQVAAPSCTPVAAVVGATLPVRLYRGVGISEAQVLSVSTALAGFYEPYELRFVTDTAVSFTPIDTLITAAPAALDEVLSRASDDTDLAGAIEALLFRHLNEFLASSSGDGLTRVVVLEHVTDDTAMAFLGLSGTLSGLGLAAPSVDQASSGGLSDGEMAGIAAQLPSSFAPTLFIGSDDIESSRALVVVAAHEMGHTFGLAHTQAPANLMNPGPGQEPACLPGLSVEQVSTIRESAALAM